MDIQVLSNLITNAGFSIAVAVYLLLEQKKKDKENQDKIDQKDRENKEYINSQVDDLKQRLEISQEESRRDKEESKKDKAMFAEALNCFNKALEKFDGIEEMKEDISVVVEKVDKMEVEVNKVNNLLTQNIKNNKGGF